MAQALKSHNKGFTLIELVVVMAIVAMLVSIAAPSYFRSVELARENALRTTLRVVRTAIDQFASDKDRYPDSLQELANARYIREVPVDAVTGQRSSWILIPADANAPIGGGMADIASGASATSLDGSAFSDW